MGLKEIFVVAAFLVLAQSVPMPFRLEIPADEVIPSVEIKKSADADDGLEYRLPNNTKPIHYDIFLATSIHNGQADQPFNGVVKILIEVVTAGSGITLHSRQQTIESVELLMEDGVTPWSFLGVPIGATITRKEDVEFLIITPTQALTVGQKLVVKITYSASLRDDNMGFYKSSYKNKAGETVWLATTQFEQTDARHAFPCYDEPQIRATFQIEIQHDSSYDAVSNWPQLSQSIGNGNNVVTKFEKTEPVQTYLIAFVVSDFKSIENSAAKKQRVFAKPKSIEDGEGALALEAGQLLLDAFVDHLGVEYAPPKMDQFAIPDFDAGAMENWGLVSHFSKHRRLLSIFSSTFVTFLFHIVVTFLFPISR